jgi:hypothetical protein
MQDLLRDWRRWNRAERVIAILLASILTVGIPAAAMVQLHDGGAHAETLDHD